MHQPFSREPSSRRISILRRLRIGKLRSISRFFQRDCQKPLPRSVAGHRDLGKAVPNLAERHRLGFQLAPVAHGGTRRQEREQQQQRGELHVWPGSISLFVTPKRAFLFDLDGTLADTLPDIAATTNHVRQSHGLSPVDTTTVRTYIGDGAKALLRRALAELSPNEGLHEALLEEAFAAYIEHHRAQCTVHVQLYPGVQSHLILLREAGHGIAVVTNKPEQFAIPVARHLGLDQFTSVIIGGDTLPTKKPDPA
ncbi:MAG TPA: HAD family hydrolase, partial [Planctomycetes bacterium]|nr:HAD family hydrolase [Planctomycetota bacterium]